MRCSPSAGNTGGACRPCRAGSSALLSEASDLDIDPGKLNTDGGAIAIGHPLGATGARLVGKAAQLLQRQKGRRGLATQCIGGGMGIAMVIEAAG